MSPIAIAMLIPPTAARKKAGLSPRGLIAPLWAALLVTAGSDLLTNPVVREQWMAFALSH